MDRPLWEHTAEGPNPNRRPGDVSSTLWIIHPHPNFPQLSGVEGELCEFLMIAGKSDFSNYIRNQEMSCEFVGITCSLGKERLRNLIHIITYDNFKLQSVFPETHFLKILTGSEGLQRKLEYTMESIIHYPKVKNYQSKAKHTKTNNTVEDICIFNCKSDGFLGISEFYCSDPDACVWYTFWIIQRSLVPTDRL